MTAEPNAKPPEPNHADLNTIKALKALNQLTIKGVLEVTDAVEQMHASIGGLGGLLGKNYQRLLMSIPGLVYKNVRQVSQWVGSSIDTSLSFVEALDDEIDLKLPTDLTDYYSLLAMLNGVIGHYLHEQKNPLAIGMQLRAHGKAIDLNQLDTLMQPTPNGVIIMVHGSCMSDLQWTRKGHNHGQGLADALGADLVYLHYNSGMHISENGEAFSHLLDDFCGNLPKQTPVHLITHSMGGLVSRSACWFAQQHNHGWLNQLDNLIFLGTPHKGAKLERWGNLVETLFNSNPFSAPLAKLATVRSHGVTDLRYGSILHTDWEGQERFAFGNRSNQATPLPEHVNTYAIAATLQQENTPLQKHKGDGLVTVESAWGENEAPEFSLNIPNKNTWVGYNLNHLDLLSDLGVYQKMEEWLGPYLGPV